MGAVLPDVGNETPGVGNETLDEGNKIPDEASREVIGEVIGEVSNGVPPGPPRRRALPFALLGYWYATAVGFVWGSLLSTGRVRRIDGLWVFRGMPKWSFGRGGSCVGACYLTRNNVGPRVIRHEQVHREQWRRYGMALPILYLLAGRNPLRNRFEIEAGLEDGGYIPRARASRAQAPSH